MSTLADRSWLPAGFLRHGCRTVSRAAALSFLGLQATAQEAGPDDPIGQAASEVLGLFDHDSVLIVGELHGTAQTPALAGELALRLGADRSVAVGVEMPREEQQRITDFLRSKGGEDAVAALMDGTFWRVDARRSDGRRSQAMLDLLEQMRLARQAGVRVDIVAVDDDSFFETGVDRRQGMANRITELATDSDYDAVVILIGNYHARLTVPDRVTSEGAVLEDPPVPTAARIEQVPVTTVNVSACSGEFWACAAQDACGPVEIIYECPALEFPVVEAIDPDRFGYHLSVTLETLTTSPPAWPD